MQHEMYLRKLYEIHCTFLCMEQGITLLDIFSKTKGNDLYTVLAMFTGITFEAFSNDVEYNQEKAEDILYAIPNSEKADSWESKMLDSHMFSYKMISNF